MFFRNIKEGRQEGKAFFGALLTGLAFAGEPWDLEAPTGLKFGLIKGYENWHVVATHFRTDKNELRYIHRERHRRWRPTKRGASERAEVSRRCDPRRR
ncbi:MAG: hypothetical protein Q9N34_05365 [Aquificota bacterium]|nr:hypothetical protein [Aquificota bacterium]